MDIALVSMGLLGGRGSRGGVDCETEQARITTALGSMSRPCSQDSDYRAGAPGCPFGRDALLGTGTPELARLRGEIDTQRWDSMGRVEIPDNAAAGVTSIIDVPNEMTASSVSIELDITHSYVGDPLIVVEHAGTTATIWNRTGDSQRDIHQAFALSAFAGASMAGPWKLTVSDLAAVDTGRLNRWTLIAAR